MEVVCCIRSWKSYSLHQLMVEHMPYLMLYLKTTVSFWNIWPWLTSGVETFEMCIDLFEIQDRKDSFGFLKSCWPVRYWEAVTQLHVMYSKWADAFSQFQGFADVTLKAAREKKDEEKEKQLGRAGDVCWMWDGEMWGISVSLLRLHSDDCRVLNLTCSIS